MSKTSACMCVGVKGLAWMLVTSLSTMAFAQEPVTVAGLRADPPPASRPEMPLESSRFLPEAPKPHKFWDGKNRLLFSAVAASSAADFGVTTMNLANGGHELNPIVRPFAGNTGTLAINFVAETAGVMAVSYLFHRSRHHRLERITPLANVAGSAFAVGYGLSHR